MINRSIAVVMLFLLTMMLSPAQAGEEGKKTTEMPAMSQEQQNMMAAWQRYMTPGEMHAHLTAMAGSWNFTMKSWMEPGAPPEMSQGTAETTAILGGRYTQTIYMGTSMGQPFEGRGIDGYNNQTGEFFSFWIDNMGTGFFISTGRCLDKECTTMEFKGEMDDPSTGHKMKSRQLITIKDKNSHLFEMMMIGPDGKEFKSMEMEYTRKK